MLMICRECTHCGLCSGDTKKAEELKVLVAGKGIAACSCDSAVPGNFIGIAFDVGTTTIACRTIFLSTGEEICSFGEKNLQAEFGSDVVSRISFSMTEGGFEKLHATVVSQVESMISRAMLISQNVCSARRIGRCVLCGISVAGNTVMESLLAGISVASLASFPFDLNSTFGFEIKASQIFSGLLPVPSECPVYFAPAAGAFIGGDIVCSMLVAGFHQESDFTRFIADIGTNCEICVRDGNLGKIYCTSTSAGPAFEGFGIECGSPACRGAVVKVRIKDGSIQCVVAGGGKPESVSGTGLVSAVSEMLANGIVARDGSFVDGQMEKFSLSDMVFISQNDIRNFQLAKGAVYSGLEILSSHADLKRTRLFLAGGFGTELDILEAASVRMIPQEMCSDVVSLGNASLYGASMLLLDSGLKEKACSLAKDCIVIDMSRLETFQQTFINSLNF